MDAGQIIHLPHPFSAFQTIQLSSHPVGLLPREPHALIVAYGDAMGLPMDWMKSRALCNPASLPFARPCPPLFSLPSLSSCPIPRRGRIYSFQFATVVHSTADRKILGEGIFFLFSPFASFFFLPRAFFPASFFLNVLFYFSFHANERQADFLWPYTQVNRYYHRRTLIPLVSNEPW